MTVADYTDTPFARVPRLHHKDALAGPSSAPFGRRNLVGMMGVMMSGGKSLPYDAEVEYLETHRKSWIDTGIVPKTGCTFYLDYYIPNNSFTYGQLIFGTFTPQSGAEFEYRYGHDWSNSPPAYAGFRADYGGILSAGRYSVKMDASGVYVDGVLKKEYSVGRFQDATKSLLLGNAHNYGYYGARTLYGKIYSFGYDDENGNQVMRLIPVRVGEVGKFYDTISGSLFDSQDEAYIIGPDKT